MNPGQHARPVIEALEPRILYSADLAPGLPAIGAGLPAAETRQLYPAAPGAAPTLTEIAFVDSSLADTDLLVEDLEAQRAGGRAIEVVLIDGDEDGIGRISETLRARTDIGAIHLFGHGTGGELSLGAGQLDEATLFRSAGTIAGWSTAFSADADILLYGCDLAANAAGVALVDDLAALTGADVAASVDATGSPLQDGNWVLEHQRGGIEAPVALSAAAQQAWTTTLVTTQLSAIGDTYIDDGSQTLNYGIATSLMVDQSGSGIGSQRALLQFDLNALPAGATITNATLKMQATQVTGPFAIAVYEVTESWFQGVGDGATAVAGASWDQRTFGTPWTTPGGTFNPTPVWTHASSGVPGQDTWNITALAQAWYTGTKVNNGLLIGGTGGGGDSVRYDSSEGATPPQLVVTFTVANQAPVITSDGGGGSASISVAENSTAVTTVAATDPDGTTPTYVLGGADAGRFTLNTTSGALSFTTAPNFETPLDANGDNVYQVTVAATDGTLSSSQNLSISVTNLNEVPAITSNGGAGSATITVAENSTAVTTVTATDPDGTTPTYVLSGADAGRFTLNPASGALSFSAAPNFETPLDANGDNVYQVTVSATDGSLGDSQNLSITVTNLNETPVITSSGGGASASIEVAENSTAVTTVTASDPDGTTPTYVITGGADSALFTIDGLSGALLFAAAPSFSAPLDSDGDNVYEVTVGATDGSLTDPQNLFVAVTLVNDPPVITSSGGGASANLSVAENSSAVTTVTATDPDGTTPTYALSGADAGRFTLNPATGALGFTAAPDFEAPLDASGDNVYQVTVAATDGALSSSQNLSITVSNLNEAPVITSDGGGTSASITVPGSSTAVTTVTATDPDGGTPTFALAGDDAGLFTLDPATGLLSFTNPPDFDNPLDNGGNNLYEITVSATDGSLSDSQNLSVVVQDPTPEDALWLSRKGDATPGFTGLTSIRDSEAVSLGGPGLTLGQGTTSGSFTPAFDIEAFTSTGAKLEDLEYVTRNLTIGGTLVLQAGDVLFSTGDSETLTSVNSVATDRDDLVLFRPTTTGDYSAGTFTLIADNLASAMATVPFNDLRGLALVEELTVVGGQALLPGTLLFTTDNSSSTIYTLLPLVVSGNIIGGTPAPLLVGPEMGINTPIIGIEVVSQPATLGGVSLPGGSLLVTLDGDDVLADNNLTVSRSDVVLLELTSTSSPSSTAAGTATLLVEGASLDIPSGALDGITLAAAATTAVNSAPVITSNGGGASDSLTVAENSTAVTTVTATDVDGTIPTYVLGGVDAGRFTLNPTTGVLAFTVVPDFETRLDANGDNVYQVTVAATDGSLSSSQNLSITVTNLNEAPLITSNGGGASDSLTVAENSTAVTTVTATDVDGTIPTYVLGGVDAGRFTLNPTTGVLAFTVVPDFETRLDANGDNVYQVTVAATDGSLSSSQNLSITVTNLNDNDPVITSNGGGNASLSLAEGSTAVTTVTATDADGSIPTYALSGADAALFTLDPASGVLAFNSAPDAANPLDANGDNVYQVTVAATDGSRSDSQDLSVHVQDAPSADALWLSRNGNATPGFTGLTSIAGSEVVGLGLAGLTLGQGNTSGTFTPVLDLRAFSGSSAELDDVEYVTRDLTIGGTLVLRAGDVLFSTGTTETLTSANSVVIDKDDLVLFRPTTAGDYSAGTFTIIAEDFGSTIAPDSFNDLRGLALVEETTVVGGRVLFAGTVLYTSEHDPKTIYALTPVVVAGKIVGSVSTPLLAGPEMGIDKAILGIELVSQPMTLGGVTLPAGSLLLSLDGDDVIADNDLAVSKSDVVLLKLASTSSPTSTASGTATLLVEGASLGIPSGRLDGVALRSAAGTIGIDPPVITSNGGGASAGIDVAENGTAVTTVTATDPDGTPPIYTLSGADAARFRLDPTTGVLGFVAAPDFESPLDVNGDNIYQVTVAATDGTLSDSQDLSVTVTNLNDNAPVVTVPPAQLTLVNTPVQIRGLAVADADAGGTDILLTLSVSSGALTVSTGAAGVPPGAITGNGTGTLTLTGPAALLNFSLAGGGDGIGYAPEADFSGAVTLTVVADDRGNPGAGPALTASGSATIDVVTGIPPPDVAPPVAPAPTVPATATGADATPAAPATPTTGEAGISPQPAGTGDDAAGLAGDGLLATGLETTGTGLADARSGGQDGLSAARRAGQATTSAVPETFAIPQMFGATLLAPGDLAAALERVDFLGQLDALRRSAEAPAVFQKQVAGFSTAASMSLTAGYVLWLLRGGALLASLVSSLPAWHLVDPLPVLRNAADEDGEPGDDEVENVFGAGDPPPVPGPQPAVVEPRGTAP